MIRELWKHRDRPAPFSTPWLKAWAKRLLQAPMLVKQALYHLRLRMRGARVAGKTFFSEPSRISGDLTQLTVGEGSFIGRAELAVHDQMSIGRDVCINDGARLLTASHILFDAENDNSQRSTLNSRPVARPHATFVGFLNQTDISKAYVAADCLVLPSDRRETWGLVINEVMASGMSCIVSDACGCAEDLGELQMASHYPFANTQILAAHILKYMKTSKANSSAHSTFLSKFCLSSTIASVVRA
jgi:hypothetical protein